MKGRFPDIKIILLGVAAASGITIFAGGQAYASNMLDMSGNGMHLTVSGDGNGLSTQVHENAEVDQTKSTSATIISKSGEAAESTTPSLPSSDSESAQARTIMEEASQDDTNGGEGSGSIAVPQASEAALGRSEKAAGTPLETAQAQPIAGAELLFEDQDVSGQAVMAGVGGRSLKLRLQPVITNSPVVIKDLAAALPTVPARKHDLPRDSNGLLGQLTMSTAAVVPAMTEVQPDMGWPEAIYADRKSVTFDGLLTVMFVISFFAAWLQRAGFVGAARSDVAALKNNSMALFQSDYDLAKGHSPFLMMLKGRGITNVVNG